MENLNEDQKVELVIRLFSDQHAAISYAELTFMVSKVAI